MITDFQWRNLIAGDTVKYHPVCKLYEVTDGLSGGLIFLRETSPRQLRIAIDQSDRAKFSVVKMTMEEGLGQQMVSLHRITCDCSRCKEVIP